MKPRVVKANTLTENETPERCFIAENYSDGRLSIAKARVKAGITTVSHHLDGVTEIYLIVSGRGQVDMGDLKPVKVGTGDLVVIPAGTSQRITNIGKKDLVFYCICTPRFTADCYHQEASKPV